jgi:hypothetical protein
VLLATVVAAAPVIHREKRFENSYLTNNIYLKNN